MNIEVTDAIRTFAQSSTQQGSTNWYENNNYVSLPPNILAVNKYFISLPEIGQYFSPSSIYLLSTQNLFYHFLNKILYSFTDQHPLIMII